MRFILQATMPPEKFNQVLREGKVHEKIQKILEETKPVATYFLAREGKRSALMVVDMEHPSQMPKLAEPWFLNFDAEVEFSPVMTPEDLQKAGLDDIAKKWK